MKGCRPLTVEEVGRLSGVLCQRDRVLMYVCLTFGLRISEALRLTFADFSGNHLRVRSSKNSENLTFEIPSKLKEEVSRLRESYGKKGSVSDKSPVFRSQMSGVVSSRLIQMNLKEACEKLKIHGQVSTHSFRKSYAEKIWNLSGKNILTVQKYLRQKNLANTVYYLATLEGSELIKELNWLE